MYTDKLPIDDQDNKNEQQTNRGQQASQTLYSLYLPAQQQHHRLLILCQPMITSQSPPFPESKTQSPTNRVCASILLLMTLLLSGCAIPYYHQAAMGQLELMRKDKPITEWLAEHETNPEPGIQNTIRQLKHSQEIRRFAADVMGLPVGNAYSSYADIERDFVVWNVFATPEFSTDAHTWCYPIIGCAQYRGYFSKSDALAYASEFEQRGFETYVGGVQAYSTLGWFDDPVLNTFLNRSDIQLAALLFHELAHRLGYAKGDTEFNESFATVIEKFSVSIWLQSDAKPEATQLYKSYLASRQTREQFTKLVLAKRTALDELYSNKALTNDQKRSRKFDLFAELRSELQQLDQTSGNHTQYARWADNLSNAKLVPINSYNRWVPAIENHLTLTLHNAGCRTQYFWDNLSQCTIALESFYTQLTDLIKAKPGKRLDTLLQWQSELDATTPSRQTSKIF